MNPDDRGKWFEGGFFPTPCNPVHLKFVYSTVPSWRAGRWRESDAKFGLLGEKELKAMLDPYAAMTGDSLYEPMFVYQLEVGDFKLLSTFDPIPYQTAARLQARLVVTKFSTALFSQMCLDRDVQDVYQMDQVVTDLTAKMMDVERLHGKKNVQPYVDAGVSSVGVIRESLANGVDPSLALDLEG